MGFQLRPGGGDGVALGAVVMPTNAEIRRAREVILAAIAELQMLGITVPTSLHGVVGALGWALEEHGPNVIPFRPPGAS